MPKSNSPRLSNGLKKITKLFFSNSAPIGAAGATNSTLSSTPIKEYVVVVVDVNKGHNSDFAAKYGADKHGLPCIVILDSNGKHLTTKDTGELEEGDHHSPEKVLAFLNQWSAKKS